MSFKTIGNIDVTVTDAYIADPHWAAKPGEINNKGIPVVVWADICLVVEDRDGNNDIWKGELSNRTGNGTRAHQEQTEITLEKLVSIGFNVPTFNDLMAQCDDNNGIPNLIGLKCTVTTEEREYEGRDGTTRKSIFTKYINALGSGGPRRISKADFMARINGQAAAPAAPAPTAGAYPAQPQGYPAQGYPQSAPAQPYPQTAPAPTAPAAAPQSYPAQGYPAQPQQPPMPTAPQGGKCPY